MKKKQVFFLFANLLVIAGLSQNKTYLGIKSGVHFRSAFIDNTIFNTYINESTFSGLHGGFIVKHFPKKKKSQITTPGIQFSIIYIQKGWEQLFDTSEPTYRMTLNYLEVPFEFIIYFGNKNKFFLTMGCFAEFLLAYKKGVEPQDTGLSDFFTYEPNRDRTVGYGGRGSLGLFRYFSFGSIHLETFFEYSISNILDAGNLTTKVPDISNLWTVGMSISYLFLAHSK